MRALFYMLTLRIWYPEGQSNPLRKNVKCVRRDQAYILNKFEKTGRIESK